MRKYNDEKRNSEKRLKITNLAFDKLSSEKYIWLDL